MAIPDTGLHVLNRLLQAVQNLSGLQRDMRNNALSWRKSAVDQSTPAADLAQWMNDAAAAYQARLAWMATAQADTVSWAKMSAMWAVLGGTGTDFSNMMTPLQAVANQLGPAGKATYAQIIAVCDQITGVINAPLSLWPE